MFHDTVDTYYWYPPDNLAVVEFKISSKFLTLIYLHLYSSLSHTFYVC